MVLKLPLKKQPIHPCGATKTFPWSSCLPFVENKAGVLIHRPRSANTYNLHKRPHYAVGFWCGMTTTSNWENNKLTFLSVPPDESIVCWKCEMLAIAAGLPSSDELAGNHVHIGGVKAYKKCCP